MIEGNFIVIDGVDGVGKSLQCGRLAAHFRGRGLPVRITQEPSSGPVGTLIRQILTGRVVVPGLQGPRPPSWNTMAALFAADRLDHLESEVVPNLMDGVTVICDRYDYSSLAFQTITGGGDEEASSWVQALNVHARRPDLSIILDAEPSISKERRIGRSRVHEMYDDEELQRQLAAFYVDIDRFFPSDNIVHVDANGDQEEVAAAVLQHVKELRGE